MNNTTKQYSFCSGWLKAWLSGVFLAASAVGLLPASHNCFAENPPLACQQEYFQSYAASEFSILSKDYFARFSRDTTVNPSDNEVLIGSNWKIVYVRDSKPLTVLMAGYLKQFLNERMRLSTAIETVDSQLSGSVKHAILLVETGGGDPNVSESFTITVESDRVILSGQDCMGLRDGIVKLAGLIGLKQAPILTLGKQVFRPRIKVRVGDVPWMGSYRDLIFRGFNAVMINGSMRSDVFEAVSENIGSLRILSQSSAIPELIKDQDPAVLSRLKKYADSANEYGLKVYTYLHLNPRIAADDPIFKSHPEIRGALIDDGPPFDKYHLCTSHPLVRRYLTESVQGILKEMPYIEGVVIIIGGEEFLHCFMRPYQAPEGLETNCPRCAKIGLVTAISDLCDYLGDAARQVNPDAEILAWPYSSVHYWIGHKEDRAQLRLIEALKPGTALFADVVKDDYVKKPGGIDKLMWDYSIDMPGPGPRVRTQIKACHARGLRHYTHTEPELAFEISRLPYIPAMDRWAQRAEGIAASGTDGVFVWSFFRPNFGTTSGEVFQYFCWDPVEPIDAVLNQLANRIAGSKAGSALRKAWLLTSDAVAYSPVMDNYLSGPMYLGPAHPMCADPNAKLPDGFWGVYKGPFVSGGFETPTKRTELFLSYYRKMEQALSEAVECLDEAKRNVPQSKTLYFEAEDLPIRWFYHAARTAANFYESCLLRDRIHQSPHGQQVKEDFIRWMEVLVNERQNAVEALPLMQRDMRLDFYFGHNGAGVSPHKHGAEMINKKIELIDYEIESYLPSLEKQLTLN